MPDPCTQLSRIDAMERALDAEKQARTRSHEKIYDRLGDLERNMTAVTTQYSHIITQLAAMSADINAIKDKPGKRWDAVVTAVLTGIVGFLLAKLGLS